jgi:hypothetical protein
MRNWTGNDRSARTHNGVVYLSESPLKLHLSWKSGPSNPARLVGEFNLDLHGLLAKGFVRSEKSKPGAIRLRFYHGLDDMIYVQTKRNGPMLPLGKPA